MARSLKKGAFADESLLKKVDALNAANYKQVIKTWYRYVQPKICFITYREVIKVSCC